MLKQLDINTLNMFPGLVSVKNLCSQYEWLNKANAELLGYRHADELVGCTDYELKCPAAEFAADFIKQDQEVLQTVREHRYFALTRYQSPEPNFIMGTKKPLLDTANNVVGILVFAIIFEDEHLIKLGQYLSSTPFIENKKNSALCFESSETFQGKIKLTERQLEVLFYLLRGKTSKEIACFLNLSFRTVEGYIDHIKAKFRCQNKSSLIEMAIYEGYWAVFPKRLMGQVGSC